MIYYNTSQEKENYLEQLYTILADILIEEVKDNETDERSIS